jgi:N-acetylmuramoyl-L-alanine amidase
MTGKELYKKMNSRMGSKYVLGTLAPKADADYKGPFDCAELASWSVYQVGAILYGCANNKGKPNTADAYTGFWSRDAHALGIIIPIDEAKSTEGAFLLRVAADGSVGHIVCSDGLGGTAEANSTKHGCINSVVDGRRWDFGIKIPDFTYVQNIKTPVIKKPAQKVYRWTNPVMVDPAIGILQDKLNALGYVVGKKDNVYGEKTYKAVKKFQNDRGLNPDGEAGAKTFAELGIKL